jgi:CRISP-associated protein Cas1
MLAIAFAATKESETIDRLVRREASRLFRKRSVIPSMIDTIKLVLRLEEIDGPSDDRDA